MKVLILNSGTGSRLGEMTKDIPKCLVKLNDHETILSRQLKMILDAGLKEVVITIGPFNDMIPEYIKSLNIDLNITYFRNEVYDQTNYIYSMYLADSLIRDDLISMHGDIVMDFSLFNYFIKNTDMDLAIIDRGLPLPEKDFKAVIENDYITEIGVNVNDIKKSVFMQPVYKLSKSFMEKWMNEINRFVSRDKLKCYAENAFNSISGELKLKGYDINGNLCMEVDTIEDLEIARSKING